MAISLHTTDFPMVLNRKFYDDLVENFQNIENYINGGGKAGDSDEVKDELANMQARITNIAAGNIDQMALDQAVDQAVDAALKRKGVI